MDKVNQSFFIDSKEQAPKDSSMLHIPVVGHMVRNADGTYHLDEEKSSWIDVDASVVAKFFIDKFGLDIPGMETTT